MECLIKTIQRFIQTYRLKLIGKSKWVKGKYQGYSIAFWFGHGLIYQEMGILRRSAFDPGYEKRIRSGSILSETTNMAAQRAGLRAAFKSPAREGRDTRRLQRVGSSCRRSRRMRERDRLESGAGRARFVPRYA